MQRLRNITLVTGLLVAGLVLPAAAQTDEPTDAPAPVPVTFFLHGTEQIGDLETSLGGSFRPMDAADPSASEKSVFVTNYVLGPNTDCDGNSLIPSWVGFVDGTISNPTVTLHTVAHPGASLEVSLYGDPTGTCAFMGTPAPAPLATKVIQLAAGRTETKVTFEGVSAEVGSLLVMLNIPPALADRADQARVFYDSAASPSRLEFTCTPLDAETPCLPE
jgi:hypothetical protein